MSMCTNNTNAGYTVLECVVELTIIKDLLQIGYEVSVWILMSLNILCPIWQYNVSGGGLISNMCGLGSLSTSLLSYGFGRYANPEINNPTYRQALNSVGALAALIARLTYALSKAAGAAGHARIEAIITYVVLTMGSSIVVIGYTVQYNKHGAKYTVIFVALIYITVIMILGVGYSIAIQFSSTTMAYCRDNNSDEAITDDEPGIKDVREIEAPCFQYYNNVGGKNRIWWKEYAERKIQTNMYSNNSWPEELTIVHDDWKIEIALLYWKIKHKNKYVTLVATDGIAMLMYIGCGWISILQIIESQYQRGDPYWIIVQTYVHSALNATTFIVGIVMLYFRTNSLLKRMEIRPTIPENRETKYQIMLQWRLGLTYLLNLLSEIFCHSTIFRNTPKTINYVVSLISLVICGVTMTVNTLCGCIFRTAIIYMQFTKIQCCDIEYERNINTVITSAKNKCKYSMVNLKYINSILQNGILNHNLEWQKRAMEIMGLRTLDQEAIGAYDQLIVTHDTIDIALLACYNVSKKEVIDDEIKGASILLNATLSEIINIMNEQNDEGIEQRGKSTVTDQKVWQELITLAKNGTLISLSDLIKNAYRNVHFYCQKRLPTTTEGNYHVLAAKAWDKTIDHITTKCVLYDTDKATLALSTIICAAWCSWSRPRLSSVRGLELVTRVKLMCMLALYEFSDINI